MMRVDFMSVRLGIEISRLEVCTENDVFNKKCANVQSVSCQQPVE